VGVEKGDEVLNLCTSHLTPITRFGYSDQSGQSYIHTHKRNILRKNPLPISLFTYYYLQIEFVPLLKRQATKLHIKRKCKGKKKRERKIEIDKKVMYCSVTGRVCETTNKH